MSDRELVDAIVQDFQEHIPGVEIRFKNDSKLMKFLGFLLAPINPHFMTKFVTTWGKAVYFPSPAFLDKFPTSTLAVMAHEFVHLWDEQNEGKLKYKHAYAAPQVYGLLTLAAFSLVFSPWPMLALIGGYVGCCFLAQKKQILGYIGLGSLILGVLALTWLTSGLFGVLGFLGALVPFAPWPSPGRTRLELRGYTMSVVVHRWLTGEDMSPEYLDNLRSFFTGPSYYFMSWSKSKISDTLSDAVFAGRKDTLVGEEPYSVVYSFLKRHDRIADRKDP